MTKYLVFDFDGTLADTTEGGCYFACAGGNNGWGSRWCRRSVSAP